MFPKTGNSFPKGARGPLARPNYARTISAALKGDLGDTHQAVKTLMRWTGAKERTVKNWLAGTNGPSGEHLIALVSHSDLMLEIFLRSARRDHAMVTPMLLDVRSRVTHLLHLLDSILDEANPEN